IFDSTALTMQEWAKVLGAGLLVFCVAELEKTIIRRSPLAARLVHA
ncbi:MAG TPA: cation-transporting ATPase Pma1, partial [Comamonadaceae bacterium]|nr:cation-transporting ATPase Pma1 [Comamonadaceae bacterium]